MGASVDLRLGGVVATEISSKFERGAFWCDLKIASVSDNMTLRRCLDIMAMLWVPNSTSLRHVAYCENFAMELPLNEIQRMDGCVVSIFYYSVHTGTGRLQ
jgi:hypothetical protein